MPTTAWCGGTWPTSRTCRRTTLQDSSGQDRESNPPVKKQRPGRQPGSCGGGWTIEGRASLSPSRYTLQRLLGTPYRPVTWNQHRQHRGVSPDAYDRLVWRDMADLADLPENHLAG